MGFTSFVKWMLALCNNMLALSSNCIIKVSRKDAKGKDAKIKLQLERRNN